MVSQMKAMEAENRRLKRMYAEMSMQNDLLKEAPRKRAVRPSQRREMAVNAVKSKRVSVAMACRTFQISETCYRYERKFDDEHAEIADWLVRLTTNGKTWGALAYAFCTSAT